jgi:hypothetical protein
MMCTDHQTRFITDVRTNLDTMLHKTTLELDLHADTCVLGRYALSILDFN